MSHPAPKFVSFANFRAGVSSQSVMPEGMAVRVRSGGIVLEGKADTESARNGRLVKPFLMSNKAVDSYLDIIDEAGWVLDQYKTNNVILYCHNSFAPPIGWGQNVRVENKALRGDVEFAAPEENLFGSEIGKMVDCGLIKANSVGFIPLEYTWNKERGGIDFSKQLLLEDSVCSIGANPEALVDEPTAKAFRAFKAFGHSLPGTVDFLSKALDLDPAMTGRQQVEALWRVLSPATTRSFPKATTMSKHHLLTIEVDGDEKHLAETALRLRNSGFAIRDGGVADPMAESIKALKEVADSFKGHAESFGDHAKALGQNNKEFGQHCDALAKSIKAMSDDTEPTEDETKAIGEQVIALMKANPDPLALAKALSGLIAKGGAPHKLSKKSEKHLAAAEKSLKAMRSLHESGTEGDDPEAEDPAEEPGDEPAPEKSAPLATTTPTAPPAVPQPDPKEVERNALLTELRAKGEENRRLFQQVTGKVAPKSPKP